MITKPGLQIGHFEKKTSKIQQQKFKETMYRGYNATAKKSKSQFFSFFRLTRSPNHATSRLVIKTQKQVVNCFNYKSRLPDPNAVQSKLPGYRSGIFRDEVGFEPQT